MLLTSNDSDKSIFVIRELRIRVLYFNQTGGTDMLKSQDVVLLLKLLATPPENEDKWTQSKLALHLCMSVSEVNAGIKRLAQSGLLRKMQNVSTLTSSSAKLHYLPVKQACE